MARSDIVHSLCCYDQIYIGTTMQALKNHLTQHKSDVRIKPQSTGLAIYANAANHKLDYNSTKILDIEKSTKKRYVSVMLHTQSTYERNVNKRNDTQKLCNTYKSLIETIK